MKKEWAVEDRPREKMDRKGAESLTDVELIAVLLGTGTANEHVMDLAERMLKSADNKLHRLANMPVEDLVNMHGIGLAKALRLKAAVELVRRIPFENEIRKITSSQDAFKVLAVSLGALPHEEFWVILLNKRSKIIRSHKISQGGLSSTIADPRIIFKLALKEKASSIVVAHNHPSGNLTPSQADIDLTSKLVAAGKLLDIQVVDHLILAGNNYCSFADSGLM